jgi:hypothetical protein
MSCYLHLDLPEVSLPSIFQPKVHVLSCVLFHQNPPIQPSDMCGWPMRLFANEHLVFQSCCFLMHPIKWLIGLMNSNLLLVHPHASPTQRADSILQLLTKLYGVTGALRAQKYVLDAPDVSSVPWKCDTWVRLPLATEGVPPICHVLCIFQYVPLFMHTFRS